MIPNHHHWLFVMRNQRISAQNLKKNDVLFVWMIILTQNNSINAAIDFVPIVLTHIFKVLNLNVHVVLPFMVKFEVHSNADSIRSHISHLGNQPEDGGMQVKTITQRLPGYGRNSKGTIQITYSFPNGTQDVSFCESYSN